MGLHIYKPEGFVKTKPFDKRDDFDFDIVNFPFLDGDVPRSTSCGGCGSTKLSVCISVVMLAMWPPLRRPICFSLCFM